MQDVIKTGEMMKWDKLIIEISHVYDYKLSLI